MKIIKQLSLIVVSLSLFACSAQSEKQPVDLAKEIQTSWQLMSIDEQAVNSEISSTLNIDAENKATGKLACNNFFGRVDLDQDEFMIAQMGSTRMLCQEPANEVEMIVTNVLTGGAYAQISEGNLELIGKDHTLTYSLKK